MEQPTRPRKSHLPRVIAALCFLIAALAIVTFGLIRDRIAKDKDGKVDAKTRELEEQRKVLKQWEREAEQARP